MMGSLVRKNKKTKATVSNMNSEGKPRVKGKFVIIPPEKVEADRCHAYAYMF